MERDELSAWLQLIRTEGLGPRRTRRLLQTLGSPTAVIEAPDGVLDSMAGPRIRAALRRSHDRLAPCVDVHRRWLGDAEDRHVLALGDPRYPTVLLHTADPPVLLFVQGQVEKLAGGRQIAVVGSRNATSQGLEHAKGFSREFSRAGWAVVSGLALGIDGAAHEGALDGEGGTVAVVGTGLDMVYPRRHSALASRIRSNGVIVSEHALGTPALAPHFPRRNRIIAGLSAGTLVVEAAPESGSLITARLAVEAGRDVFAIPGSIHSPMAKGCHSLIRDGALLVEGAHEVLAELTPTRPPEARGAGGPHRTGPSGQTDASSNDTVMLALGHDPVSLDALSDRTGLAASDLNRRLFELEMTGDVERLPGALFQRRTGS